MNSGCIWKVTVQIQEGGQRGGVEIKGILSTQVNSDPGVVWWVLRKQELGSTAVSGTDSRGTQEGRGEGGTWGRRSWGGLKTAGKGRRGSGDTTTTSLGGVEKE